MTSKNYLRSSVKPALNIWQQPATRDDSNIIGQEKLKGIEPNDRTRKFKNCSYNTLYSTL